MSHARPAVLTVSQLAAAIKGRLEDSFPDVQVRGEVSSLATPASGHVYFTLKDAEAAIRCVLYRHIRRYLRVAPRENEEYLVRGKVSAYGPRSEYQIVVDYLEPVGLGALHAAFLALQQKLAARGWFAQARKRPLPVLPRTIGIVTSLSGAALYDMLKIIQARRPGQHVVIAPSLVQGESAPASIAWAIRLLADHASPDVIIVGRGGGSLEDLWCWNEEEVVRAVVECPVPVVSGVGHEVDVSLCDLAADVRAATPTHAAELVVPDVVEIARRVTVLRSRATRAVQHERALLRHRIDNATHRLRVEAVPTALLGRHLDELRERLQTRAQRFVLLRRHRLELLRQRVQAQSPHHRLRQRQQRLDTSRLRLRHIGALLLERRRQRLLAVDGRLQDVSPLAVLERGYAIVTNAAGKAVRVAQETAIGELLDVRLHEGRLKTRVEEN